MSKVSQLTVQRNRIISEATTLVNAGLSTKEQKEAYNNLLAEADLIQGDLDMLAKIERSMPELAVPVFAPTAPAKSDNPSERRSRLNKAYRSLLRHGYRPDAIEQRDITVGGDGFALIPQEFDGYTSALKAYGPIAALVKVARQATGRPRKFTVSDDTAATMQFLSESSPTSSAEAYPTLQSTTPATDTLVTVVKYSLQELEDADDLGAFLADISGLRVARAVEYALTLGKSNGGNFVLPNSPSGGLLGNVPQGAVTTSLSAGIPYSALVTLAGSVDHAYYVGGSFMASPSVFNYLLDQTDSTGRPLYPIDSATGLMQIAGKPLYVNAAMPAFNTASSPVVLFGDFSKAYAYVNAGGVKIQVLAERYIDTFEAAAVIHHRLGAAKLVTGAVKALVTAAS